MDLFEASKIRPTNYFIMIMTLCGVLRTLSLRSSVRRYRVEYWRMHDIETYNQEAKLVIMLNVFIHEFHEIFSGHAAK